MYSISSFIYLFISPLFLYKSRDTYNFTICWCIKLWKNYVSHSLGQLLICHRLCCCVAFMRVSLVATKLTVLAVAHEEINKQAVHRIPQWHWLWFSVVKIEFGGLHHCFLIDWVLFLCVVNLWLLFPLFCYYDFFFLILLIWIFFFCKFHHKFDVGWLFCFWVSDS